ncbi:hypothetical protein TNCV_1490141, partial [Trichonephila clavipes]
RALAARRLFKVPDAAKALYIYKHPYILRDSNPSPTAQQPASLTTIPHGRRTVVFTGEEIWDSFLFIEKSGQGNGLVDCVSMISSLVPLKSCRAEGEDTRKICRGSSVLPLEWRGSQEGGASSGVVSVT